MNTATATNPVLDQLSTEELAKALEARGMKVQTPKAPKEKVEKPVKTDEELLLEALGRIVTVEDGKIVVIPAADRPEKSEQATIFEALSLKSRTTLAKIEDAKKPPVEGKKRGPKSKAEKEALAAAQNAEGQPEDTQDPSAPAA